MILGGLAIAAVIFRSQLGAVQTTEWLAALLIFLFWPLLEWAIHVFMLHRKPSKLFGREVDFLLPQTHRWHHADPWNLKWVFIPLHVYPIVAPLILGLVWLISPNLAFACTVLATYFLFALHYEWVHYLAHINWCPPLKYYQRRVREHRLHHFRNEQKWWGVSMGLGDRLLGTAPHASDIEASPHTHKIIRT
ncbi:MAG: sterol desaturase family protein [Gammaproteobacteria bacterium]|nr:sterol desaturase family protein [Gammaproteobacteria bacterium]